MVGKNDDYYVYTENKGVCKKVLMSMYIGKRRDWVKKNADEYMYIGIKGIGKKTLIIMYCVMEKKGI